MGAPPPFKIYGVIFYCHMSTLNYIPFITRKCPVLLGAFLFLLVPVTLWISIDRILFAFLTNIIKKGAHVI